MQRMLNVVIIALIVILFIDIHNINNTKDPPVIDTFIIETPSIFIIENEEVNDSIMLEACYYFGVKEPYIVTAQAILESGNFNSNTYKYLNNPFGLYDSKHRVYYKFEHWTESLQGYINMIEYRQFKDESYYHFLNRIGYAEDPEYIHKVKVIEKRLKRKFPP